MSGIIGVVQDIESGQSTPGNSAPDLTPKGLVNDDGNYILQQDDMYSLLKYVCAGLLLPVTDWEYIERLNLSQDTTGIISSSLEPLIATYVTVCLHLPLASHDDRPRAGPRTLRGF